MWRKEDDAGMSEIVGTLLMVGAVVLAGGGVLALVTSSLSSPAPPIATFALAPVAPGEGNLTLLLRQGERLALDGLSVSLARNGTPAAPLPRTTWTTLDTTNLRVGDALVLPLTPPARPDERLHVVVAHNATNSVLAALEARASTAAASVASPPVLVASLKPAGIVADATAAALLAVRVDAPAGSMLVAGVSADLSALAAATNSAGAALVLADDGTGGDLVGGDGVFSGLVRASIGTPPGPYTLAIRATDISGQLAAATSSVITITTNLTSGNATSAEGNLSNFTGNFSGNCYGCVVTGGSVSYEGTRLLAPTSANITTFHLTNWTWDRQNPNRLDGDAGLVRIISQTYAWSAYFKFEAYGQQQVPGITRIEMYDSNRTTVFLPSANGYVPLAGLTLDMLDPTSNGFRCEPAPCPAPGLRATYQNADIRGKPGFVVAWLRDETNNFQTDELGIFSMDVILA